MKYRFKSATVLDIMTSNNILLEFYQNRYYMFLFYVEPLDIAKKYQKIPKNIELIIKPILLNQFILGAPPKCINYTEAQGKQVDLLFNLFRSL